MDYAASAASNLSNTAQMLFDSGIAHSKSMFRIMKAMRIAETIINTVTGVMKAIQEPLLPWPTNVAFAATVGAMGAAQIAAIAAEQFPAARHGGIFTGEQLVRVGEGDTSEAVIPLRGGNVPVAFTGGEKPQTIINNHVHMEGATFLDQETLQKSMATIAVSAVVRDYSNDGNIRTLMKRGA